MPAVDLRLTPALHPAVVFGAEDPSSTRLVYAMAIGLVVIGVVLVLLGVWIIRQTRPDLEVLAPLERMGDSDWKKKDPSTQRRILDELRPDGAEPLVPALRPPSIDADFEQTDHPVTSFNDLGPDFEQTDHLVTSVSELGSGVVAETSDPTPTDAESEMFGFLTGGPAEPQAEEDPEPVAEPEAEPAAELEPEAELEPAAGESDTESELEPATGPEPETETETLESDLEVEPNPRG